MVIQLCPVDLNQSENDWFHTTKRQTEVFCYFPVKHKAAEALDQKHVKIRLNETWQTASLGDNSGVSLSPSRRHNYKSRRLKIVWFGSEGFPQALIPFNLKFYSIIRTCGFSSCCSSCSVGWVRGEQCKHSALQLPKGCWVWVRNHGRLSASHHGIRAGSGFCMSTVLSSPAQGWFCNRAISEQPESCRIQGCVLPGAVRRRWHLPEVLTAETNPKWRAEATSPQY